MTGRRQRERVEGIFILTYMTRLIVPTGLSRGPHHLRSQTPQDRLFLLGHFGGQGDYTPIPLQTGQERQAYTGVARGGFDDD